jgi:hypothetical protein
LASVLKPTERLIVTNELGTIRIHAVPHLDAPTKARLALLGLCGVQMGETTLIAVVFAYFIEFSPQ